MSPTLPSAERSRGGIDFVIKLVRPVAINFPQASFAVVELIDAMLDERQVAHVLAGARRRPFAFLGKVGAPSLLLALRPPFRRSNGEDVNRKVRD